MSGRRVAGLVAAGVAAVCLLLAGCGGSEAGGPRRSAGVPVVSSGSVPSSGGGGTSASVVVPPPPVGTEIPADVPMTGPNLTVVGESPPVMPVAALAHTPEGAVAFAQFFIQTMDWGFATTSSAYMRHYYAPTCIECASHADSLDATGRAGHRYLGGRFKIISAAAEGAEADGRVPVLSVFDLTSVEVVDSSGQFVNGGPAEQNIRERVFVAWSDGRWVVADLTPS